MQQIKGRMLGAAAALALSAGMAAAADVEVLHWWTSGGEAAALNVLKEDLEAQDIGWQDMPVAGGGGTQAMTVLRARVTSGNPPTAVQMLGFDITDWAKEGALANLNAVAGPRTAGTRWCRRRCRSSRSTTATGSPRRSTSTRPTGSGRTSRCSTSSASPSRRPGTS